MGKKQHSKDRMFITASEWASEYGGKKRARTEGQSQPLPFDHCALSLMPFETPVMLKNSGIVYDFVSIVPYLKEHKKDPATGEQASSKDIVRLNMAKNSEGQWHCPVTCKVFTNSSYIVAIAGNGNVYSYDAVLELNIKPKNYVDLLTGESFKKSDIITIQNVQDAEVMSRRDVSNFVHLSEVRSSNLEARKSDNKLRHNPTSESIMKEIEKTREKERELGIKPTTIEEISARAAVEENEDVADILIMKPLTIDVNPGQVNTDGKASSSFTSSATNLWTSNATRLASGDEIREAKWKVMRKLGKKAYVQLQTNLGNINVEIHCDMAMRTSWNFITLCNQGYYNGLTFHRHIPGFMIQTGDPTGTGTGGESAFKKPFKDEFDTRLSHCSRGILSMANSGPNTNGSQFFITFMATPHLDLKHTVFGRVVGGLATLDRLEEIRADKKERPITDLKVITAVVFTNPVDEAEIILKDEIAKNIQRRLAEEKKSVLPTIIYSSGEKALEEERAAVGMTRSIEDVSKKRKVIFKK